jgi:hypothetical protein
MHPFISAIIKNAKYKNFFNFPLNSSTDIKIIFVTKIKLFVKKSESGISQ